jgi:hypothetical protein
MFLVVYLALRVLFKLYLLLPQFDGSLMTLGLMAQRLLSTIYGSMMMVMLNLTLNQILRLIFLLPFWLGKQPPPPNPTWATHTKEKEKKKHTPLVSFLIRGLPLDGGCRIFVLVGRPRKLAQSLVGRQ